ncbi:uncharacterized protein DSM5745_08908 [Aspergillus mulundensis]|uniref:Uncharacterized protein n=1 Tax=Aspergillus mulundensis TaxID=1810919 RepID=A0A3D8R593_9EURO|nr:hypothetical protein DSM5745_08908 [Aspergillus mulundensis]RDW69148.1 hypothetical protein DSM5745_08908 [Aspergillus mulundensis]
MPFLYNLVDRLADVVIAAVSPPKRPHERERERKRSFSPPPRPNHRPLREEDYDDEDDDYEPLSYYSRRVSRQVDEETLPSFAEEGARPGPGYSSRDGENARRYRAPHNAKRVRWGGIKAYDDYVPLASAPGLSEFPQRRTSTSPNYVYGAEDRRSPRERRKRSPGSSPRSSPSSSRSGSKSREGSPKLPGSYEEGKGGQPAAPSPPSAPILRQLLHRTHVPRKSILKAPTATDDEMMVRNLWSMVVLSQNQLEYTYEFLSSVMLIGDDVLDTMWTAGEMTMFEEANKRARRSLERERRRARHPILEPRPRYRRPRGPEPEREMVAPEVAPWTEGGQQRNPVSEPREMDIIEEEEEGDASWT